MAGAIGTGPILRKFPQKRCEISERRALFDCRSLRTTRGIQSRRKVCDRTAHDPCSRLHRAAPVWHKQTADGPVAHEGRWPRFSQGGSQMPLRCPAIRKAALKHYGCVCHRCDLRPKNPTIIEVHHLFPIADGTRKTKIEDVIPLCRNCHELAHTENPPIPIDRLKTTDF